MEIQCPSFQILLAFLLFMIMALKIRKIRSKTKYSASNLPPGPWKQPVIGNLHQLAGSLPHQRLRDLAKKYGPLMHLKLGEVSTVVVSSAEFAKEVMKTHDLIFASRPQVLATRILSYGSTNIAFAPYGEYWKLLRKICTLELLSAKRVRSYRPIREEEVQNLIKSIALRAGSPINLTQARHLPSLRKQHVFPSIRLLHLLSGMRPKLERLHKEADRIMGNIIKEHQGDMEAIKAASGFALADVFPSISLLHLLSGMRPKLERLHKEADRIMGNIIKEHQGDMEAIKAASGFALADVLPSISLLHLLSGMRPKLERLHKEADRIMGNIIKKHQGDMVTTKSGKGEAEEDLLDVLLKFHEHGNELEFSLTTENIKAVILKSNHSTNRVVDILQVV
ncbi:unnamed protein product [Prunus armeniaca]